MFNIYNSTELLHRMVKYCNQTCTFASKLSDNISILALFRMLQRFLIFFLGINTLVQAQTAWKNTDYTYVENIKTAYLLPISAVVAAEGYVSGFRNTGSVKLTGMRADSIKEKNQIAELPIVDLLGGSMELSFDDLDGEFKYYRYKIEHCNADWTRSALNELEYIEGYSEDRLPDGKISSGTNVNFINYQLSLPNNNTRFKKSGNYLLHIFLEQGDVIPILTKRFCLVERALTINAKFSPVGNTEKIETHQELDFTAIYKSLNMRNAQREIKAVIIQNGNWNTAKYNIKPNYNAIDILTFDYQDSIVFNAGKEFRPFDIRSLVFERIGVKTIEHIGSDGYEVTLKPTKAKENEAYQFFYDINGGYIVANVDLPNIQDIHLQSDYANVHFTLLRNAPYDGKDVFLYAKITDWQMYESYKMQYNDNLKAYTLDAMFKQGYYDYGYALVDKKDGSIDLTEIDGDSFNTENNYTILIYHRPLSERYDKLIGYGVFNSLINR